MQGKQRVRDFVDVVSEVRRDQPVSIGQEKPALGDVDPGDVHRG